MFNSLPPQIVFQEVPDHVSLAFTITGCPLRCVGCHSPEIWNRKLGQELSQTRFEHYLCQYRQLITCVLFFGGEWCADLLIAKLASAQAYGLKTCLYTGSEQIPTTIQQYLDFLKVGAWRAEFGGLSASTTNQRFYDLHTGQCLNDRFLLTELT